jgi:hypothetical protein
MCRKALLTGNKNQAASPPTQSYSHTAPYKDSPTQIVLHAKTYFLLLFAVNHITSFYSFCSPNIATVPDVFTICNFYD